MECEYGREQSALAFFHARKIMRRNPQQNLERRGAGMRVNPRRAGPEVKAKGPKVFLPYIVSREIGSPVVLREWSLSWRSAREADLRDIWNGAKSLDKAWRRSSHKSVITITKDSHDR